MKKILYIALAAAGLLAGCNKDDNMDNGTQGGEVRFTAGVQTRAYDATWELNDAIGVFAFDSEGTVENGTNEPYRITDPSTGAMSPATAANKIYYTKGKSLSFYAYYPYSATAVSGTTLTVDATDQSTATKTKSLDLMWAKAESQTTATVSLPFAHKMTKLHFGISAGGLEVSNLTGMTATLEGANATAAFDLNTGTFGSQAAGDITLNAVVDATDNTKATIEAFVVPTADLSNVQLVLTMGRKNFGWKPASTQWIGGESNPYTISVGRTPIPITNVTLNKEETSIIIGETETLTATLYPENATNQDVTWSSSEPTIAAVSSSGVVSGIAKGATMITVTTADGNKTASCVVKVIPGPSTVTFNSNGGTAVASKQVAYDATTTRPITPTRQGHTFGGWYKEGALTNLWNFATDRVTAPITLYAKWVANSTVTDSDGNVYPVVTYGNQTWIAANLRVTQSAYGRTLRKCRNDTEWMAATNGGDPAYCAYHYNDANVGAYGYLYNGNASIMACPRGWRLPDYKETMELINWLETNGVAFAEQYGGLRDDLEGLIDPFARINEKGLWWIDQFVASRPGYQYYMSMNPKPYPMYPPSPACDSDAKTMRGCSVRCMKVN